MMFAPIAKAPYGTGLTASENSGATTGSRPVTLRHRNCCKPLPMRALFALVFVAGCSGQFGGDKALGNDNGPGPGGEGAIPECSADSQCMAAGLKCCDSPTYAIPTTDPA